MDKRSLSLIILFSLIGASAVIGSFLWTSRGKIIIPGNPLFSTTTRTLDFSKLSPGTNLVITKPTIWQADAEVSLKVAGTDHPVGSLVSTSMYAANLRLNFTGGPGGVGDWISIKWYIRAPVNWAIYMTNWAGTPYGILYGITNAYGDIRTTSFQTVAGSKWDPTLSSGTIVEAKFTKTSANSVQIDFTIYSGGIYGTGVNKGYGNEVVLSTNTVQQTMPSNFAAWNGMVFSTGGTPAMELISIITSWNSGIT